MWWTYKGVICPCGGRVERCENMNLVGFEECKKEKDNRLYVIDPNTEKITNYINKGDRIVRKSSIDAFRSLKEQESEGVCDKWEMREFYKANTEELQLVMKELTQFERSFMFSITPYISFEHNSLIMGKGNKAVDIGTEQLIEITGLSRSMLYEVVKSLIDKDIIFRGKNSKNTQYYVNPWLYCKGNRINKVLRNMFKNYKILTQGGVLWKDFDDNIEIN